MAPIRAAVVGLGKITVDQHIPSISNDARFELVAGVSPRSRVPGLPTHRSMDHLFFASKDVDAVAINTPPQVRFELTSQALLAGKHVMLEKRPSADLSKLVALEELAASQGVTLYTGWHSQYAPGVVRVRERLAGTVVHSITVAWCEDVRQGHPAKSWIWEAGGLDAFDPGISALSILVAILPASLTIGLARFDIPSNWHTPVAADIRGSVGSGSFAAKLDVLQTGLQTLDIVIDTDDGRLGMSTGGADLTIDGEHCVVGPSVEYPLMYRRFAELHRCAPAPPRGRRIPRRRARAGRGVHRVTDPLLHSTMPSASTAPHPRHCSTRKALS